MFATFLPSVLTAKVSANSLSVERVLKQAQGLLYSGEFPGTHEDDVIAVIDDLQDLINSIRR